jgi:hypothetical protein
VFVGPVFFLGLAIGLTPRSKPCLKRVSSFQVGAFGPILYGDRFFLTLINFGMVFSQQKEKMELALITYWHFNLYPDSA